MKHNQNIDTFLEVAISTLNDGIYSIKLNNDYNYFIVHQVNNSENYNSFVNNLPNNVRYLKTNTIGLSKSRNIALQNAKSKYLWIMDDDVELLSDAKSNIFSIVTSSPDCGVYVISHSHESSSYSPHYSTKLVTFKDTFKISSIDMIVNVERSHGIMFDEDFGLGTNLPSGEEFLFVNSILKKGDTIFKYTLIGSLHPVESSGLDFYSSPNKLRAKLLMLIKCKGKVLGMILYLIFLLKKMFIITNNKAWGNVLKSFS